ncbi:MAG: hypothetical protein QOK35_2102 [Pseudonocardiales bacterium]|jgi:hypothetical protein|nr:hypothetical protein [Pseudonocardiales bacterium]
MATEQTTTESGPSDDYSYDLAHEVQHALRIPTARRPAARRPMRMGRPVDADGDLGYDDAHEAAGS